jgi:hypothetical protein
MRANRTFWASVVAFTVLLVAYGLKRFTLGVDFSDEGAYVAWPLRVALGEPPFAEELLTLLRPVEVFLSAIFRIHPDITLYQLRIAGWSLHLLSFIALSLAVFRSTNAPILSPLIACIPLFVSHIFGLAPPAYNSLSSDFLLLTFSLKALAASAQDRGRWRCEVTSGITLFLAVVAHPALSAVALIFVARELLFRSLLKNVRQLRITPSNASILAFAACSLALVAYLVFSGAASIWLQRLGVARSLSSQSFPANPVRFLLSLAIYPLFHTSVAIAVTGLGTAALLGAVYACRRQAFGSAGDVINGFLLLIAGGFIVTSQAYPDYLTTMLALGALMFAAFAWSVPCIRAGFREQREVGQLLLLSLLATAIYASFTFYFSAHRSWVSGSLALPFAFAMGAAQLIRIPSAHARLFRLILPAALGLAALCVAGRHYISIQRDAPPALLDASFQTRRLRHLRSTPERVAAVDALHAYLQPKLRVGERVVIYDDCPLLYYVLQARPAYGLAWAVRHGLSEQVLRQLDAEFRAKPLPAYAIRTMIDLALPTWTNAPRTRYENYPLNETVMANYELERTIFPFEIWRRRSPDRAD